jgi:hypothetical protein
MSKNLPRRSRFGVAGNPTRSHRLTPAESPVTTIGRPRAQKKNVPRRFRNLRNRRITRRFGRRCYIATGSKVSLDSALVHNRRGSIRAGVDRARRVPCTVDTRHRPFSTHRTLYKLRVRIIICRLTFAICHMPSAVCPFAIALCHLPFAICDMPSAECHLPSAICHLPSAICHLPSAICIPDPKELSCGLEL